MPFSYLPHTADVTFVAKESTLEGAFQEAARAFTGVMTDDQVVVKKTFPISISSKSKEALVFDFIDELILLLDTEGVFIVDANVTISQKESMWSLEGTLGGDIAENYVHHGDIKAPTYHALEVTQEDDGWKIVATLDV